MSKLETQKYIFVLYQHGSSGAFIASLVSCALNRQFDNLDITRRGEMLKANVYYGAWNERVPRQGAETTPFDVLVQEHIEKVIAPLHNYSDEPGDAITIVVPSHNYDRIPLYRAVCPNQKILYIQNSNWYDWLISRMNGAIKYVLGSAQQRDPVPTHAAAAYTLSAQFLSKIINPDNSMRLALDLQNSNHDDIIDVLAWGYFKCIMPLWRENLMQCAPQVDWKENDVMLPYKAIRENDVEEVIAAISALSDGPLDQEQLDFIHKNWRRYMSLQDNTLLNSPDEYFRQLETKAMIFLSPYM